MHTEIEKTNIYMLIKWGTIALTAGIDAVLFLSGTITMFAFTAIYIMLFVASLVNLCLWLAVRSKQYSAAMAHLSLFSDVSVIVVALYFAGGMENTWLFNPVIIIYAAGYIFSLGASLFYAAIAFTMICGMFFLEYNKIIPHFSAYGLPEIYWRYPQYVSDYLMGMFVLYFIAAVTSGVFNRILTQAAERINQSLAKSEAAQKEAVVARNNQQEALIKLAAANSELERQTHRLGEKMAELKEFNDLAVGRELKMIELEKEIELLKKK